MADKIPRNRILINVGLTGREEKPEPDLPVVSIDGVAVHNVTGIYIRAGLDQMTEVTLSFHAEVTGTVQGFDVEGMLKGKLP